MDEPRPKKSYTHKETPAVLKSYPSLKRGNQELKVRLLQYSKSDPILDIREFIHSEQGSWFSRKGITLDYNQLLEAIQILANAQTDMEEQS